MSYSHSDDLENAREQVAFLEKVIKKYTDVEPMMLCDGTEVYASGFVDDETTDVDVVVDKSSDKTARAYRYVNYAGRRVYFRDRYPRDMSFALDEFKRACPEAHARLVAFLRSRS